MLLPLTDKTILVTRAAGQSSQFSHLLSQKGARVLEMPALEIGPPSTWQPLDDAIAQIATFDWLILTSTNGVQSFFDRLAQQRAALPPHLRIAVVGKKTAQELSHLSLEPDFIPPDFVADSLVAHFPDGDRLDHLRILFPRVEEGGREVLVKEFMKRGATVVEVPAYASGCAKAIAPDIVAALQQGQVDMVTFASSKTVACFAQLLETHLGTAAQDLVQTQWRSLCIASIGPQTSLACQNYLGRVDIEAQEYTLEGLTQAIVGWAEQF